MRIRNLEITTKIGCSNNCSYCPQDKLIKAYGGDNIMSLDTFKKCIKRVGSDVKIGFTGFCEPFLNPKCLKMVKYAAKRNTVYVSTTLNGLKLRHIKVLEKINFSEFAVHLPSKGLDHIPVNKTLLMKVVDSSIVNKSYHYHGTLHPEYSFMKARKTMTHSRAGNMDSYIKNKVIGPVTCRREFRHPVLLPNGDLVLCCMDYGLKHILGNLLKQGIDEIYAGSKFKQVIKANKKGSGSICHECHYGKAIDG